MDNVFPVDRLQRLAAIERFHFWFAGRQELLRQLLQRHLRGKRRILDLGCGTGWTLENLRGLGFDAWGLDLRPEGLVTLHIRNPSCNLLQADAVQLPFAAGSFDGIVLLDVLEHVAEADLLAEIQRVLRPGGMVVLTTPAIPSLWSYRDEAAGHLRRYTRRRLEAALVSASFKVVEIRYYQCFLLPLVAATRWLGRRRSSWRDREDAPSRALNRVFRWINRFEVGLSRHVRMPLGSTLAAVCEKA